MAFLLISIALDITQVHGFILFYYLSGINLNGWMASFLAFMILFEGLDLRLTINRRGIIGLRLIFDFVKNFILVLPIIIDFIFFD